MSSRCVDIDPAPQGLGIDTEVERNYAALESEQPVCGSGRIRHHFGVRMQQNMGQHKWTISLPAGKDLTQAVVKDRKVWNQTCCKKERLMDRTSMIATIRNNAMRVAAIFLSLCMLCSSVAFSSEKAPDLIFDTGFLMDKVGKPGWVILDVRRPHYYTEGHIPRAVLLPRWISKLYADDRSESRR